MTKQWFKAKRYGWGWYPSSWQGWAITLGYVVVVIAGYTLIGSTIGMHIVTFILAILLIWICYKTGEKPRWRWGK